MAEPSHPHLFDQVLASPFALREEGIRIQFLSVIPGLPNKLQKPRPPFSPFRVLRV